MSFERQNLHAEGDVLYAGRNIKPEPPIQLLISAYYIRRS